MIVRAIKHLIPNTFHTATATFSGNLHAADDTIPFIAVHNMLIRENKHHVFVRLNLRTDYDSSHSFNCGIATKCASEYADVITATVLQNCRGVPPRRAYLEHSSVLS